ncbi:flavodoxin [Phocaeicola sartorii]|uniref:flavodoxin n=1 Tax=Phocaeicola sartorii TaxID=671267 RepID=UPI00248C837A|nr:flavodoxin [Phocaeicola sartorii]
MKKLVIIPLLLFSLTGMAACSPDNTPALETEQPTIPEEPGNGETPDNPDQPSGNGKTLVAYFSAQGHTQAVAERIVELTGADVYRIEAAEPYAANPYDDSDCIQNEAYKDLRPGVANLPDAETIAQYNTIFVGSPCWWHQPAMVVCTFLEAYDLKDKTIIPFITYGATTYLNESMQKIYKLTPDSKHIPETLPEDLDPEDITTPGRPDDAGIDMPGNASGTEAWLKRIGIIE